MGRACLQLVMGCASSVPTSSGPAAIPVTSFTNASHIPITRGNANRSTTPCACAARRLRSSPSASNRSMAAAKACSSSGGTSTPSTPSVMISRGPLAQSKLITGRPQAIASHKALGKPSRREDKTNRSACCMFSKGCRVKPGKDARPCRPRSSRTRSRSGRRGPSPQITSDHSGCFGATRAKAPSRRSNPFSSHRRPKATTVFVLRLQACFGASLTRQ